MKPRTEEHRRKLSEALKRTFAEGRVAHNKGVKGVVKDSDSTREKKRSKMIGRKHSQETKDKIGSAHKGKTIPAEVIARQQATMKARIESNGGGFATGKRSDEFSARMSEIAKARPAEFKAESARRMQEARRGSKATDEQRETYRQARLKVMRDNPNSVGVKMWFDTLPEREFATELDRLGVSYKKQYHTTKPHYLYDFLVQGKYLVEIDGPYHYERKFYKTDEDFQRMINRDAEKNMAAGMNGFSIYRIQVSQHLPDNWQEILDEQGLVLTAD